MHNYYTAGQAIKLLKIGRTTFYEKVKKKEIPSIKLPLRDQAIYPKKDIDRLAAERARILDELEKDRGRLIFIIPNRDDLRQLVDNVNRMAFYEETLVAPEKQQRWLEYNSEAIHVIKDTKTNMVVGGVTISPLEQNALTRLLNLEIDETELKPEDFQSYKVSNVQDCYVIGIVVQPGIMERYYASRLLHATLGYLMELLDRGVVIRRIYTVAGTEDGDRLARRLHFTQLPGEKKEEHEVRHPYVLDLESQGNKSKLVTMYLKHKKNMERRQKRYQRQHGREQ